MKIGIIQMHSVPEMIEENVDKGIRMYKEAVKKGADLIVFPELWTCGYYLETKDFINAVKKNDFIIDTFQKLARDNEVVTILPLPQLKDGNLYIGLYLIEKNGNIIAEYQKSFLWGREQKYFVPGKREYTPVETSVGKIGLLICYDIEFPEPSRILAMKGADIIFVPSVWSIPAENRWKIQLPARALDNTVFICGINNVGEGTCGKSMVVSPEGTIIAEGSDADEEIVICEIEYSLIDEVRAKIPYLKEYDNCLYPGGDI